MSKTERLSGVTVCIVDDDDLVRALAARVITSEGGTAVLSASLSAFRATHARIRFDAVVMDLRLTNGNGIAELALHPELPGILCTGYPLHAAVEELEQKWVVLEKPFAIDSLTQAILDAIARKRPPPTVPETESPGPGPE